MLKRFFVWLWGKLKAVGAWIAGVVKVVVAEVVALLGLLKGPSGKYSSKRVLAVGGFVGVCAVIGVPRDVWQAVAIGVAFIIAAVILIVAAVTKT